MGMFDQTKRIFNEADQRSAQIARSGDVAGGAVELGKGMLATGVSAGVEGFNGVKNYLTGMGEDLNRVGATRNQPGYLSRGIEYAANSLGEAPNKSTTPPVSVRDNAVYSSPNGAPRNTLVAENSAKVGFSPKAGAMYSIGRGDPNGSALAARVNTQDMNAANAEYAKANAIRQQTIDAQPKGAGIVIPPNAGGEDQISALYGQAQKLLQDSQYGNSLSRGSKQIREAELLQGQADTLARLKQNQNTTSSALQRTAMDNAAAAPYRDASATEAMARARTLLQGQGTETLTPDMLPDLIASGVIVTDEDGAPDMSNPVTAALLSKMYSGLGIGMENGGVVGMAEGGMVPGTSALGRTTPQNPAFAELQDYQRYASGSQAMGLPPVAFEQFMEMRQGATAARGGAAGKGTMGFEDGGEIPDTSVAGKMVIDTDPATDGDTIPAMIDGEQPAALKSGEFVFPDDVVMFFGTDKLNKMIAQARKTDDGPANTATGGAAASPPAAFS